MGTHDPSICVSTTLSAFVVAKDEGDMVENVCCPTLIELVLESNTICASCSVFMVAPTKGTPTVCMHNYVPNAICTYVKYDELTER